MTIILIPLYFKKQPSTKVADDVSLYLYAIIVYAFVSTLWVSYEISYWYIFYQLLLALLTLAIPHLMSKITNDKHINYPVLISNFSLILSGVFLVFILRQEENVRLNGYLGGAALIGIIMIPVIAVHFHNLLNRKRVISSFIGFLITSLAIFLTESRVALAMLILFVVITILRKPTIKRLIISLLVTSSFFFWFFDDISTERYNEILVDDARGMMFDTAIKSGTHSLDAFLFGNGYGYFWKWRAFEIGDLPLWQYPFQPTEFGYIMFHAHSVFNQLFSELGLVGILLFVVFVSKLIMETFKSWKNKFGLKTDILVSIICSLPGLMTELLFFRNWEVTVIWLFYVFTALNYIPTKSPTDHKE